MNRKIILCCVIGISLLGSFIWWQAGQSPSLQFVELREMEGGRHAVLRIVNNTNTLFSFLGEAGTPFYLRRAPTNNGWKEDNLGWCGTGAMYYQVPPHSSREFTAGLPFDAKEKRFAFGVHFEQGTAEEIFARRESQLTRLFQTVRYILRLPMESEPEWSALVEVP